MAGWCAVLLRERLLSQGRNLAHAPHCVIAIEVRESEPSPIWHLVAEGEATIVRDEATLHGVAEEYTTKYDWHVTLRDGAIQTEGAPTAGPPPYDIYRVALTTVFALGKEPSYTSTRWRF